MFSSVQSVTLEGLRPLKLRVEVDITGQALPSFNIVGLPDAAVSEARERVRSAIKNSGFAFPIKRITVNLAPADLKKEGSGFDLPIALGILAASNQIPVESLDGKT
ncbi:MAG: magnesium chelatase, partial [Caldisericales bacterium]|nr:magnesium chelatase [Caldisericales bacterium]